MRLPKYTAIRGPITVTVVGDAVTDGSTIVCTPGGPAVQVAVLHDGSEAARGEAAAIALLVGRAPLMLTLITRAVLYRQADFEAPEDEERPISGADLLDWYTGWRAEAAELLAGDGPDGGDTRRWKLPETADAILEGFALDQGWDDESRSGLLLSFLNGLILHHPAVADDLRRHLAEIAEIENGGGDEAENDDEHA